MWQTRWLKLYREHFRLVLFLIITLLILLAWYDRFIQDDAFISFRYADQFAHGKGLVWNEGERVEGYTNFSWTLLLSLPLRLGRDPVIFSYLFGLVSFALSLVFTYRLAHQLYQSKDAALLVIILLGTNYTFSCYATGGLETQLQACLFVSAIYLTTRALETGDWSNNRLLTLSILLSLALLTRPDSALLLAVILPVALFSLVQSKMARRQKLFGLLSLILPMAVLVGGWLAWKVSFYGNVLPNTFYAKVSPSASGILRGIAYFNLFLQSYWLIPFPLIFLFFAPKLLRQPNRALLIPAVVTLLWLAYMISVGGDFMEFRFLVPVLPLIFTLFGWLIFVQLKMRRMQMALTALILAGSLHHALTFAPVNGVNSIPELSSLCDGWQRVGKALGKELDHNSGLTIATTAAGAVPYYSRLKTVDMFGLNDPWVARHGAYWGDRPGHQRRATLDYLVQRRVNLIVGHPLVINANTPTSVYTGTKKGLERLMLAGQNRYQIPPQFKYLEIPIDADLRLLVGYLTEDPLIEEAIRSKGWRATPYEMAQEEQAEPPPKFPLYTPGTRIDLTSIEAEKYLWYGWSGFEPSFRWSNGDQAALSFSLQEPRASMLRIRLGPFLSPGKLDQQRVHVMLNGQQLDSLTLNRIGPQSYTIELPASLLRERNVLGFGLPDAASPWMLETGSDTRWLGISVEWFEIDTKND
ncbi:MAG TPA: hypothetical protein VGB17_17385 [Pyrinomonadaceae bacterium]|jgi:hypothetical protein